MLSISNVSMNYNQPWAKSDNFEASTVHFEVILKRLSNSYGNVLLNMVGARSYKYSGGSNAAERPHNMPYVVLGEA